jgi:hypothetical protein
MRELISEKNFDFLCFQETIMQDFPESFLRQVDPIRTIFGTGFQPEVGQGVCYQD